MNRQRHYVIALILECLSIFIWLLAATVSYLMYPIFVLVALLWVIPLIFTIINLENALFLEKQRLKDENNIEEIGSV